MLRSMPVVVASCVALLAPAMIVLAAGSLPAVESASTLELLTTGRKSGEPRKVTIWFVRDGDRLAVQSGKDGKTDWYRNLKAKPEGTVRVGDLRLPVMARFVEDPAEIERLLGLFRSKYLLARLAGWVGAGFGRGKPVLLEPVE